MELSDLNNEKYKNHVAFLRALVEQNGSADTVEIREFTENNPVETLDSKQVRYSRYLFSCKQGSLEEPVIETFDQGKDENGSIKPKVIKLREEYEDEVEHIVENFYFDLNDPENIDDIIDNVNEISTQLNKLHNRIESVEELKAENEQLRDRLDTVEERVESHEQSLEVLRKQFRPVVEGMSKFLRDKMNFNPKQYIEK